MDLKKIEQIEASLIYALDQIKKLKEEELVSKTSSKKRNTELKLKRKSKYMAILASRK